VGARAWWRGQSRRPFLSDVPPPLLNGCPVTPLDELRGPIYVGLTIEDEKAVVPITIDSISPRLQENTAGASFGFYVCDFATSELGLAHQRDFERMCPHPIPVTEETSVELGSQQLVVSVTAARTGVVRMQGADVTYARGWQHGTETFGPEFRLDVR